MSEEEKTEKQNMQEYEEMPWIDIHLIKEAMDHLWDSINGKQTSGKNRLAGNISKSEFIQDKDDWFYENVVKELTEYLYYKL